MKLPTLYKKNTQGKIEQWKTWVEVVDEYNGHVKVFQQYGEHKGKQQIKSSIAYGKNLGKKNETSDEQQAELESKAKWTKKLKAGYVTSIKLAEQNKVDKIIKGGINPMKYHKWGEKKVFYPHVGQPKLDGEFCQATRVKGEWSLWTRTRKIILSCPHIVKALSKRFPANVSSTGFFFNAELYVEGMKKKDFEKLMSAVRKQYPSEASKKVQLHIFDWGFFNIETGKVLKTSMQKRINKLHRIKDSKTIKVVRGEILKTEKEADKFFNKCVKQGLEGSMHKKLDAYYEQKRSPFVLKRKPLEDAEFKIINVKAGKDKTVIFECVTKEGNKFECSMNGDKESNQKYLTNTKLWKGKLLTVEYQNFTGKNNVPRFPQGKRIRNDL